VLYIIAGYPGGFNSQLVSFVYKRLKCAMELKKPSVVYESEGPSEGIQEQISNFTLPFLQRQTLPSKKFCVRWSVEQKSVNPNLKYMS